VDYLDAFVPTDGVSCNALCGPRWTARIRELADAEGDGWLVPMPFSGTMGLPDDVAAWYVPRLVSQPLATLDDPAELSGRGDEVPRTYVRFLEQAGQEQDDPLRGSAARARAAGWRYREVVAPHDLHVSNPGGWRSSSTRSPGTSPEHRPSGPSDNACDHPLSPHPLQLPARHPTSGGGPMVDCRP
jgi:hypothetical protein